MFKFLKNILSGLEKVTEVLVDAAANGCMFYNQRDILAKNNLYIYDSNFIKDIQLDNLESEDIIYLTIKYYSEEKFKNLNNVVIDWGSLNLFEDRKKILETICNTLSSDLSDKDKCNLLVPLLISLLDYTAKKQIDNIFEYDKPRGFSSLKNVLKKLKEELSYDDLYMSTYITIIDYIHYDKNEDREKENGFHHVPESVMQYNLNRNAIIHGDEVNYGTVENLIRLIHMVNFIYITEKEYIKYKRLPQHTLSIMNS